MLRFSIRDLSLVTVIAAVSLAWILRERQLQVDLDHAQKWRGRAGALEHAVERQTALEVHWESEIGVRVDDPSTRTRYRIGMAEPSDVEAR